MSSNKTSSDRAIRNRLAGNELLCYIVGFPTGRNPSLSVRKPVAIGAKAKQTVRLLSSEIRTNAISKRVPIGRGTEGAQLLRRGTISIR